MTSSTGRWQSEGNFAALVMALVASGAVVATETALSSWLLDRRLTDVVMVYLLGVVLVAMRFGYAPSLFTAAASVAAFDFFFTVPYFSFAVTDKRYVLTFAIMFFVAFVISNRTERIRRIASDARQRETRTAKLYAMSRELAVARSTDEIMRVLPTGTSTTSSTATFPSSCRMTAACSAQAPQSNPGQPRSVPTSSPRRSRRSRRQPGRASGDRR